MLPKKGFSPLLLKYLFGNIGKPHDFEPNHVLQAPLSPPQRPLLLRRRRLRRRRCDLRRLRDCSQRLGDEREEEADVR